MRHPTEMECPRCRIAAAPVAARHGHCTHCDAELVPARGPSEEWIRAYLYGDGRDRSHFQRPAGIEPVSR